MDESDVYLLHKFMHEEIDKIESLHDRIIARNALIQAVCRLHEIKIDRILLLQKNKSLSREIKRIK